MKQIYPRYIACFPRRSGVSRITFIPGGGKHLLLNMRRDRRRKYNAGKSRGRNMIKNSVFMNVSACSGVCVFKYSCSNGSPFFAVSHLKQCHLSHKLRFLRTSFCCTHAAKYSFQCHSRSRQRSDPAAFKPSSDFDIESGQ